MNILVQSISSPIADLFTTYRDYLRCTYKNRSKLKTRLFNNVISFYTSTSIAAPSMSTTMTNSPASTANASSLVVLHEHRSNVLSRVYVPIAIIPVSIRDQISTIISQAVANYSDLVFSILFTIIDEESDESSRPFPDDETFELLSDGRRRNTARSSCTSGHSVMTSSDDEFLDAVDKMSLSGGAYGGGVGEEGSGNSMNGSMHRPDPQPRKKNLKLVTVGNHNLKLRISPLDIQLIYALIKASDSQLSSTESLWLPLCLSRIDPNRFMYAHISYLTEKYCLVLLDLDHGDFQLCQQVQPDIYHA